MATAVATLIVALDPAHSSQWLQSLLTWIETLGTTGAIAFMGLYTLATVLLIPGSVLPLGDGVLFGVGWGSVYVWGEPLWGQVWPS